MRVIDLDSHSRSRTEDYVVDPEYGHLRPRSFVDGKGNMLEIFNGKVIRKLPRDTLARTEKTVPEWRAADYDATVRYKYVTEAGIDFQFVSAGIVGEFNYIDAKVGAAFLKSNNNWLCNNFMNRYPKTFTGVPQLPLQDTAEAIKELERCVKDLGMRTFLMPSNWNGIDMADPYWWNFWDKVRDLGITGIIVHRGGLVSPFVGRDRFKVLGSEGSLGPRVVSALLEYFANIINLIFGGTMDAFPEFRFAFLEAGAEFAIVLKHRIEENLEQIGYLREGIGHSVDWYFNRFYFVVDDILAADGRRLNYTIEELDADHLFFGSDYPHTDSDINMVAKLRGLTSVSEDVKQKILGGNATNWFGAIL